jgi:tRNA dimethylallyltransferase
VEILDKKIIFIAGPTASGKTKIAVEIAKEFGGEVMSADSMQIYRRLNIGTAKPSIEERGGVLHHLLDFVDPRERYSAAAYQRDARRIIGEIFSRGNIPIVAGGTGLYFNCIIYDMSFSGVKGGGERRGEFERLYDERGGEFMLEFIRTKDPAAAEKLHKNDKKRIVRAFEICGGATEKTVFDDGKNDKKRIVGVSEICGATEKIVVFNDLDKIFDENTDDGGEYEKLNIENEKADGSYSINELFIDGKLNTENKKVDEFNSKRFYENYIFIGLAPDRQKLYEKINRRTDEMMKNGLLDEVRGLLDDGLTFDMQCMQSIGYKEFKEFFTENAPIESVVEKIKQPTRNYAKRQFTWFRRYDGIKRFDSYAENVDFEIKNYIKSQMQNTMQNNIYEVLEYYVKQQI